MLFPESLARSGPWLFFSLDRERAASDASQTDSSGYWLLSVADNRQAAFD
jgi:hypothetical protein